MDAYAAMSNFRKKFTQNPIRSSGRDYYRWKILANPYCTGHIELEFAGDIVTGSASITPKRISVLGEALLAAEIGDTFTHPGYRKMGIFSRGVKKCTEFAVSKESQFIYGKPNAQSLPGYQKKLGYPPCLHAKVMFMEKYLCANPLENVFRRKLKTKYLSRFLSYAYFYFLSLRSFIQKKDVSHDMPIEILPITKFDKEIDGLWGTQRKDYTFFTIRDDTYLNWRFFSNPDDYEVLVGKMGNTCLGYIILKISKGDGFCVGSICDFITYRDRTDVFIHLLNAAERLFREAGVHCIQLMCSVKSHYFESIYRSGYLINSEIPIVVYIGTDIGKQIYASREKWHFTMADSDNI